MCVCVCLCGMFVCVCVIFQPPKATMIPLASQLSWGDYGYDGYGNNGYGYDDGYGGGLGTASSFPPVIFAKCFLRNNTNQCLCL